MCSDTTAQMYKFRGPASPSHGLPAQVGNSPAMAFLVPGGGCRVDTFTWRHLIELRLCTLHAASVLSCLVATAGATPRERLCAGDRQ